MIFFRWHGNILLVCSRNDISANKQTPLPSTTPLRFGYDVPQGGEAKTIFKPNIDLANRHSHQPTSPLPMLALTSEAVSKGGKRRADCPKGVSKRAGGKGPTHTQAKPAADARRYSSPVYIGYLSPSIYAQTRVVSRLQSPHNLKLSTNVCRR